MNVGLRIAMSRLASELERAAQLGASLEEAMDHGEGDAVPDIRAMQSLDLLNQTLADLARFTEALPACLSDSPVDLTPAFDTLILRDVATRLAGDDDDSDTVTAGELAFF